MIRLYGLIYENVEPYALDFLRKLIENSPYKGKVFLAGGAVRDEILRKPIKDIDLVVSDPNGGIEFAIWLTKKIGAYVDGSNPVVFPRFGTAKFNLRGAKFNGVDLSSVDIESVMTRGEIYKGISRKPDVVYASLAEDALRRDLTINSLYKDIVTGEILDLTGKGLKDINNHVIRTPLDPDVTFSDDPLRMLRVIRFATRYNWKISKKVVESISKNHSKLKNISAERIQDEFNKILMTDHPDLGVKLLVLTGLSEHFIPELERLVGVKQNVHHDQDVFNHILSVVKKTPLVLKSRLAALFHDIGKPNVKNTDENGRVTFHGHEDVGSDMTKKIMNRLKYSSDDIDSVSNVVKNHMRLKGAGPEGKNASDKALRRFMVDIGSDLDIALPMIHADNISHSPTSNMPNQIDVLQRRMKELAAASGEQTSGALKPKLPISGNDIIKTLGIKPGPIFKKLLAAVEDAWMDTPGLTKDSALDLVRKEYEKLSGSISSDTDMMYQKVRNPETGNDILIKTALKYDDDHPAKISALQRIKSSK